MAGAQARGNAIERSRIIQAEDLNDSSLGHLESEDPQQGMVGKANIEGGKSQHCQIFNSKKQPPDCLFFISLSTSFAYRYFKGPLKIWYCVHCGVAWIKSRKTPFEEPSILVRRLTTRLMGLMCLSDVLQRYLRKYSAEEIRSDGGR